MKKEISKTQRMLNMWAVILIVWSVYRSQFETTLPIWLDEFVIKPAVFLIPLYYYILKYEHKPFFTALGWKAKEWTTDLFLGLFIGGVFFFSGGLANYIKEGTVFSTDSSFMNEYALWLLVTVSIASAMTEELLSRGFVLKRLYQESKNAFSAVVYASILFFFLRIPMLFTIDGINGFIILQVMVTDLFLSLVVGTLYVTRKNILLPILVHAFYNMSLYYFL